MVDVNGIIIELRIRYCYKMKMKWSRGGWERMAECMEKMVGVLEEDGKS